MTATPLIVPMVVDALLANKVSAPQISTIRPDWRELRDHRPIESSTLTPHSPYNGNLSGDEKYDYDRLGVYLQWELPAALRTARPDPKNPTAPNFPKIPNRWIVLRHHRQKISEKAHPVVRGWFIRSDIKAANDDTDYAAILPDKAVPNSSGGYPVNEFYGCVYPLNEEEIPSEEDDKAPEEQFLTAESAFLPAFTQYQPYNQNIFSFHDKWDSLIEAQKPYTTSNELTVSYLVAGWYSDTHSDLIQSTAGSSALSSLLQELGWKVEGRLPDAAEHSIYVGTVMAMPWRTNLDLSDDDYTYSSSGGKKFRLEGRPSVSEVTPVVAHSSIEAQAALLGQNKVSAETVALWEAFQYQLLDDTPLPNTPPHTSEPLADYALGFARHDFSFSSEPGGIVWQLSPTGTASQPVALTSEQAASLQQLNTAQAAYDRDVLQLRDLTTRLKGLWWITSPKGNEPTPAVKAEMDKLAAAITTCLKDMSERRTKLLSGKTTDELVKSIEEWCKEHGIPADCELRPVPRPAFRKANNPVVLLQGLQDPERKDELDGYLGGLVPVRSADPSLMSGKGPSSNLVYDTDDETETAKDNYSSTDVIPARIAKHLAALYDEFTTLESVAFQNPLKKGTSYRPLTEVLKEKTPNSYVPPYTRWWRQPWRPTFIQWTAKLYPTQPENTQAEHYIFAKSDDSGIYEYCHKKNVSVTKKSQDVPKVVRGYTWITPTIEQHTRYMLEYTQKADLHFGSAEYQELNKDIAQKKWDVLSFTLVGINEALAGRRTDIGMPAKTGDGKDFTFSLPSGEKGYRPPADVLTAAVPHLPLFTDSSHDDDKNAVGGGNFSAFPASAHSAQVCLTELTVTDSFGRTLQILKNYKSTGVITAPSLTVDEKALSYKHDDTQKDTEPAGCLIELLPRIHQGARLIFELDQIGEPSAPATAPIRAWLMATRFGRRRAMLCYTPTGQPLFEIHCIDDGPARCRPLPSSPYKGITDAEFTKSHPQLSQFLGALLTAQSNAQPLQELFYSLDNSFTTIAPPTPQGPDSSISSLLTGRPCALVDARLRLELDGPPLPAPTVEGLIGSPAAPKGTWPVLLGDPALLHDGLIGYFTNKTDGTRDYSRFYSHHPDPTRKKYTAGIEPKNLSLTPQDATKPEPAKDLTLTLLVCPDRPVHAVTDIVPVTQLAIPQTLIDKALSAIRPAFPLGPALTPVKDAANAALTMPAPTLGTDHGAWVWAQRHASTWAFHRLNPPQPTDDVPVSATEARTGFLQLVASDKFPVKRKPLKSANPPPDEGR